MFRHSLNVIYSAAISIQLTGFSPKGMLKMRHFVLSFCKLKQQLIFLSVFITIIIISDLTININ